MSNCPNILFENWWFVYSTSDGISYAEKSFVERYGYKPQHLIEFAGLIWAGPVERDNSDEIQRDRG
jgi:hypothetical protein